MSLEMSAEAFMKSCRQIPGSASVMPQHLYAIESFEIHQSCISEFCGCGIKKWELGWILISAWEKIRENKHFSKKV
jgi:hypothetical protein